MKRKIVLTLLMTVFLVVSLALLSACGAAKLQNPQNVDIVQKSDSELLFSWDCVEGADGYLVYFNEDLSKRFYLEETELAMNDGEIANYLKSGEVNLVNIRAVTLKNNLPDAQSAKSVLKFRYSKKLSAPQKVATSDNDITFKSVKEAKDYKAIVYNALDDEEGTVYDLVWSTGTTGVEAYIADIPDGSYYISIIALADGFETSDPSDRAEFIALKEENVVRWKVTFDANYDGGENTTSEIADGKVASSPELDREGYDFTGWYWDSYCLVEANIGKTKITAPTTFFAGWALHEEPVDPDDPFVPDTPDEPEVKPCTYHYDGDGDDKCDNCGAECKEIEPYTFKPESGAYYLTGIIRGNTVTIDGMTSSVYKLNAKGDDVGVISNVTLNKGDVIYVTKGDKSVSYSFDTDNSVNAKYVDFADGSKVKEEGTYNIFLNKEYKVYIASTEGVTNESTFTGDPDRYYLIGKLNGKTDWSNVSAQYILDNNVLGNVGAITGVELKAGDTLKVVSGDGKNWRDWNKEEGNNIAILDFDETNGIIKQDGVYNIYLSGDNFLYIAIDVPEDAYYLVGYIGGEILWDSFDDSRKLTKDQSSDDLGQLIGVELKKDDKIRIRKNDASTWFKWAEDNADNRSILNLIGDDGLVKADGTYNIYLNSAGNCYITYSSGLGAPEEKKTITVDLSAVDWFENDGARPSLHYWYTDNSGKTGSVWGEWQTNEMTSIGDGKYTLDIFVNDLAGVLIVRAIDGTPYNKSSDITSFGDDYVITVTADMMQVFN